MKLFDLLWLSVILWLMQLQLIQTITCNMGYGQRGLKNSNGISWTRECPNTMYCFEAVTSDIQQIKHLIDYPWVSMHLKFPTLRDV
jgi:hypothetical protein